MVNFEGYLQSLITTYEQWWKLYALTDAIGQIKGPERPLLFDFGLMVKTAPKRRDTAASETSPRQERQEKTERLPVLEGIRKYAENHVLLLGRPGSGKSTALIRLLLEMATEALEQSTAQIPILVELRYWQTNIFERIQAFLYKHDPYINFDDITLTSLLRKGRFLLLIDGLNELPSEEARSKLSTFRSDHPKVPMIFTTRDLGLGGDLGIEKQLEMQPLTETQMKVFIRAYVPEQEETMLRQLSDRLRELGQTPLLLWMLCEVFQQSAEHQIPSNLAGVFQTFTNLYEISSVRKHEVALLKGDVRPLSDRRLWKVSLQALASVMMQGETPVDHRVVIHRDEAERELSRVFPSGKLPTRDILDDLLKYHLLQNRSADQIEFRHQLIQEYYSAEYLLRRLPELNDEQLKRNYLNHLKWTEPIALMLALLDKDYQALRVVKLAMDDVDLMLGARLAGEVKSAFQKQTVDWVKQCKISHHLKILLLAVTSSQFSVPELLDAINNPITDISIAATNALGKIGCKSATPALLRLLENANTNYDPVAKSAAKAIGKIANRESIPRLVELLISKDFEAYQLARLALTEIGNEEVSLKLVEALRRCNNFEDCAYIASTLGDLGHSIAIPDLISFGILNSSSYEEIDDCGVQWSGISRSFENFGISVLPELISILENRGNYLAKIRSVRTIEQLKLREGIPALCNLLNQDFSNHRLGFYLLESVVYALINLGLTQESTPLIRNLQSYEPSLREEIFSRGGFWRLKRKIACALVEAGDRNAIPALMKWLRRLDNERHADNEYYALRQVIKTLASSLEDINSSIFEAIFEFTKHENSRVRSTAIESLSHFKEREIVLFFLELLLDEESSIRKIAYKSLRNISPTELLNNYGKQAFLKLLDLLTREIAKKNYNSLLWHVLDHWTSDDSEIDIDEQINYLLQLNQHSNSIVRRNALFVLSNIISRHPELGREIIPIFLNSKQDLDLEIKLFSTMQIWLYGDKKTARSVMIDSLQDASFARDNLSWNCNESIISFSCLAKIIPKRSDDLALEALELAMTNPDRFVRFYAISGIESALRSRQLDDELALPFLMLCINDPDFMVHERILEVFQKVGRPIFAQAIPELKLVIQDNLDMAQQANNTIEAIQATCKFYNYEIAQGLIPKGKTISLYFSYAPADEPLQTQLANHLTLLKRQGIITSWSKRQILPGDEPAKVINQQLNTAEIILLLISANSMADDTCYDIEIQRAMERYKAGEARVIPILLRPVVWTEAPFSQLSVLPKNHQPVTSWENQDEAFQEIAESIRAVAMEVRKEKEKRVEGKR